LCKIVVKIFAKYIIVQYIYIIINQKTKTMKARYYKISYTKAIGGQCEFIAKGRNEKEAIANAKDNCFTGKDFKVVCETEPTKNTVRGGGSHRM
jgi:hypothetical protein